MQPWAMLGGILLQLSVELIGIHQIPVGYLARIELWLGRIPPCEDGTHLVLATCLVIAGVVGKGIKVLEYGNLDAKLFCCSPVSGFDRNLAWSRVTAAAIRPESRPESCVAATLGEQEAMILIEKEDRKGAVQDAIAVVTFSLRTVLDHSIFAVDHNQEIVFEGDDRGGC
jgi:hypothetical protein